MSLKSPNKTGNLLAVRKVCLSIEAKRHLLGFSVSYLSELSGVSEAVINRIESHCDVDLLDDAIALIKSLGIKASDMGPSDH